MDMIFSIKDSFDLNHGITSYTIPYGVTEIGGSALANFKSLKELYIPDTVKKIDYQAFKNCRSLERVVISSGVTEIDDNAFEGCTSLKTLTLPKTVKRLGKECFKNCHNLERIILNEGLESMGDNIFEGCDNLKKLYLPGSLHRVESNWFSRETLLEEVTLGEGIQSIQENAFYSCQKLRKINLPKSLEVIEKDAFAGCGLLKEINIPSCRKIGETAFLDCNELHRIILPSNLLEIGQNAFINTSITELTLPIHLEKIYPTVLREINTLKTVKVFYGNFQELYTFVKNNVDALYNLYIYKGKDKIKFIGPQLSFIEKTKLALVLNIEAFTIEEPKKEVTPPIKENIITYTGNQEIDAKITEINILAKELDGEYQEKIQKEVDAAIKEFINENHLDDNYNIYVPRISSDQDKKSTLMNKLDRIISKEIITKDKTELIQRAEYFIAFVDGYVTKPIDDNSSRSKDIIHTLELLKCFPPEYQNITIRKILGYLFEFKYNAKKEIDILYDEDRLINPDDCLTNLTMDIENISNRITGEFRILEQYFAIVNALNGVELPNSKEDETTKNIFRIKRVIDALPEGEQKDQKVTMYAKMVTRFTGEIIKKTTRNKSFYSLELGSIKSHINSDIHSIEYDLNKIYLPTNYKIEDYEALCSIKNLTSLIVNYKSAQELLNFVSNNQTVLSKIYNEKTKQIIIFAGPGISRVTKIRLAILLNSKAYRFARPEEGEPPKFPSQHYTLHIDNAELCEVIEEIDKEVIKFDFSIMMKIRDIISEIIEEYKTETKKYSEEIPREVVKPFRTKLEELLIRIKACDKYVIELEQLDYYFILTNGSNFHFLEIDSIAEDILTSLRLSYRLRDSYQFEVELKIRDCLLHYEEELKKEEINFLEGNSPINENLRAELALEIKMIRKRVTEDINVMENIFALESALKGIRITDYMETSSLENPVLLNAISSLPKIISSLPEGEEKKRIQKAYEELKNKAIKELYYYDYYTIKIVKEVLRKLTTQLILITDDIFAYYQTPETKSLQEYFKSLITTDKVTELSYQIRTTISTIEYDDYFSTNYIRTDEEIKREILKVYSTIRSCPSEEVKKFYKKTLLTILNNHLQHINRGDCKEENNYQIENLLANLKELENNYLDYIFLSNKTNENNSLKH